MNSTWMDCTVERIFLLPLMSCKFIRTSRRPVMSLMMYCGRYYFLLAFSNEIPDNRFQLHNSLGNLKSHVLQGGISEQGRQLISASEMLSVRFYHK